MISNEVKVRCNEICCNNEKSPSYTEYPGMSTGWYTLICNCGSRTFHIKKGRIEGAKMVICQTCGWKYDDYDDPCPKCKRNDALIMNRIV